MTKPPVLSGDKLIKLLKKAGFHIVQQAASVEQQATWIKLFADLSRSTRL
ncbi:MAG: hypothetical protein L3J17_11010 [Candidatus Jettenia sp.]|nr:MAG: hypothetical protein L3J17_11010 [Candidatus Jettenia sp.]